MVRRLWPQGGLWRHGDFLKLWSAETISQFGSQVTNLALPLVAIITLGVSAFEVSVLLVVEFAPFLLLSLPAGVWVDRLPRRPILITADFARAVILLTVPIAYVLDVLTIWQLYVGGFLFGVCTVFFDVAYQSYLPSLVERTQLVEGNSKLEISRSGAQLGGPAIAGVLIEILRAPIAVLIDAISFFASGVFVLGIKKREENVPTREERRQQRSSMKTELAEGLRWVLGNRYLRTIASCTATFNFFGSLMGAMLVVYLVRSLEFTPSMLGLMFAIANIGYLGGALTANRVAGKIGVGPAIYAGALCGVAILLVPLAPQDQSAFVWIVVAETIVSYGVVLYNVTQVSMRQAITPERLQGRMNSVMRFIVWGVMPLGTLLGGTVATAVDLRTAIWAGAIGTSLAWLPLALGPIWSLREVPDTGDDALPKLAETEGEAMMPGPFPQTEER